MTSLFLLLWIAGGVLLQLAIYGCIVFWRHWQAYRALRNVAAACETAVPAQAAAEPMQAGWVGYRSFHVERKIMEDATAQVCSFYLVPEDKKPLPPFLPGQFLTFQFDVPSPQGGTQTVIRCYSLSDAPHADRYRISVKRAPAPVDSQLPPGQSSNFLHDHVDVGSQLQVRAPAGHFYLEHSDAPVVLVGGGIGITPMLSMLNWCLAAQPGRELWLFYGVRNQAELVMQAHLQALATEHANFHLHLCLSNPQAGETDAATADPVHCHHSRVDVALLRRLLPLKPYHFYICGPTPLLQSLVPALEDWGVPEGRIHFEAFGPASIPRKRPAPATPASRQANDTQVTLNVKFAKSGRQARWAPGMGSLLEFAESLGIAVNSGCRAGACGSCQTPIHAGEVVYSQTPDFDPEPGNCLLCVCTPKTALTLEA